jgi:hypothetical protein
VTDLLATRQELNHFDVGFGSLTALDLTTPAGRAMAGPLAILVAAQFPRRFWRAADLLAGEPSTSRKDDTLTANYAHQDGHTILFTDKPLRCA